MKKLKKRLVMVLCTLCILFCSGCASFDAGGYLQAILDNAYRGDTSSLIKYTKCSEEEASAVYMEGIDKYLASLLGDAEIEDSLKEEYRNFIIALLEQTKYEVGESVKNSDGSYTVTVTTYPLTLTVNTLYEEKKQAYIDELNEVSAKGEDFPSNEEIAARSYALCLEAYNEALADASYGDAIQSTVTVSIDNKLYTPNQSELDAVLNTLIILD